MNDHCPCGRPRWLVAVTLALVAACTGSPGGSGADEHQEQGGSEASTTAPESGGFGGGACCGRGRFVCGGRPHWCERGCPGRPGDCRGAPVARAVLRQFRRGDRRRLLGDEECHVDPGGIALDGGDLGSVEQTLAELLPDYAATMAPEVAAITLRQVLTMTAGLPGDTAGSNPLPFETADDWIAAIVFGELVRPPGRGFAYASAGSHLLSAILVEATSRSVLDYAREKLFRPTGHQHRVRRGALAVIENLPVYEAASFAWPIDPQGRYAKIANRRRRILRRHRQGRSPLRQSAVAVRRRDRTEDGPAAPRAPPAARQRLLHKATRARLRVRVHLRELQLLPDQHRVPAHPARPTRPRRQPRQQQRGRHVPATAQ